MARRQTNNPVFATWSTEHERWTEITDSCSKSTSNTLAVWLRGLDTTVKFGDPEFEVALSKPAGFVPGSPWFNSLPVLVPTQLASVGILNLLSQELMSGIMFSRENTSRSKNAVTWPQYGSCMLLLISSWLTLFKFFISLCPWKAKMGSGCLKVQ